jgi:hypothetical protein
MKKLFLVLAVVAVATSSCRSIWGKRVRGDGSIKSEERTVNAFKNVEASGAVDVYVTQGELKPVKIETDGNLLQYVEVIQSGDKIIIRQRRGINLDPTDKVKVYVTTPVYNKIEVSGASNIYATGKLTNAEDLKLDLSGAGTIKMELDAPAVHAEISGAGSVDLRGQTKSLELDLTGAANAHCFDLLSENTDIDITGAGEAEVYASVKLNADVSGAGSVSYKGGATNVSQHVTGAGSVKKID